MNKFICIALGFCVYSHDSVMKRIISVIVGIVAFASSARAQFTDSASGLLQMPTAEIEEEGTFMITNNYLNKHSLSTSGWGYDTFAYGFNIAFWNRLEVGYVCTIFDGKRKPNPTDRDKIMFNQDRHFTGKIKILNEGEFGLKWVPAFAVGISDPTTGSSGGGYADLNVEGSGNGYFNRVYAALSKNFGTRWGRVGVHLAYIYNRRTDYPINGPAVGVCWRPVWLESLPVLDWVNIIAEYDARTGNAGFIASVWDNRFELMFEMQNMRWINFGARFKLRLAGHDTVE